ncbi:hypothetical protein JCM14469_43490 [Desulfatiferula olefinivorans]
MNNLMDNLPDLSGRCVSISIMDDDISHDLNDPHFEIQGGRLFIVGTTPKGSTSSDWIAGCQCAIAWDRVTDYVVFKNLKAYTKSIKISEEFHKNDSDDEK